MLIKNAHQKRVSPRVVEIPVQGSKHSFSRVFPSFLQLKSGILRNVPDIKDVDIQIDILKKFGFELDFDKTSNFLRYSGVKQNIAAAIDIGDYSSKYSRSLINLYPLFSRFGIELKEPTGCPIGRRDISWYADIMNQFGIEVELQNRHTRVHRNLLKHVDALKIRDRSFSSTNIAVACAIEAKSDTKIFGPSLEPEIFDLINMLKNADLCIDYNSVQDCLDIHAGRFDQCKSVDHTLLPDRNVIVTQVCGALLLKKDLIIDTLGFSEEQLQIAPFTDILEQLEIECGFVDTKMMVKGSACQLEGKRLDIKAGHYPLFSSDWQPLIAVLSVLGLHMTIEDTLFESRFGYLQEYKKFGVKFKMLDNRRAEIYGSAGFETDPREMIQATALDLRCGAGLGLLAMLHEGECQIHNVIQIKRGYEHFDKQLNTLFDGNLFRYQEQDSNSKTQNRQKSFHGEDKL